MKNGKRGAYAITYATWINQDLLKDCGIIPYLLYKNHGFHSVMAGGGKFEPEKYPYLKKYVRGLEMDFFGENTLSNQINYIDAHADDMDLLILAGAHEGLIPIVEHYRKVRPDGKIYLGADMHIAWAANSPFGESVYKKFLQSCDVVTTSCRAVQKYISIKWNVPVDLIRNGWYNFAGVTFNNLFERKENIILTVGRIGTNQKRNDIMLEAFAKVADELPDWKLRLVGSIEDNFKPYIEKFFAARPDLKERVTFTGIIEDKIELMEEFKRAKIFCLTSTFEGAPNVAAEALFAGDFLIFSDFDVAYETTDDNRCGRVFPIGNVDALAQIFREVCRDENLLATGGHHAVEYAKRNFDAERIVAKVHYLLYGGNA